MKTVYLAGPITGLSFDDCTDWREYACKRFNPGIHGLSPMRGKEYLKALDVMPDCVAQQEEAAAQTDGIAAVLSSQRGIMARDYYDCTRADVVLANLLGAETVSIGTTMEIAWCHATSTPLVLVMEPEGNLHDHCMLREAAGWRTQTLEEGIHVVNAVLSAYVGL